MGYIDTLADEGYDVASSASIKEDLVAAHNNLANVWEGVKHARSKPAVGAVGACIDIIERCLSDIERWLVK